MKTDTYLDRLLNWIDPSYPLFYALEFDTHSCVGFMHPKIGWVYYPIKPFMRFRLWARRREALVDAYLDGVYSRRRALLFYARNRYILSPNERPYHSLPSSVGAQVPNW